jgi:hypothetical protein
MAMAGKLLRFSTPCPSRRMLLQTHMRLVDRGAKATVKHKEKIVT